MTEPARPPVRIVDWGSEKQLQASVDVGAGVLLLAEYPIAFVETGDDEDERGPWLLLEAILCSGTTAAGVDAADLKLSKWPLDRDDEARLEQLARRYRRNARKLAQLYHRVAANNIRYAHDAVRGYGIWPTLSRANHSCDPNARIAAARDRPLVELLLATRPIAAGTAICWNYLSDPAFLEQDWFTRNARLHRHFQFLCRCPRCDAERPPQLDQLSKTQLAEYFHRH